MKTIGVGQAHGKVIWMGEHAVVYGYLAIAIPLTSAHVMATIKKSTQTTISSQVYQGPIESGNDDIYPITTLIQALMHHFKASPLDIKITSDIPHDAGLGSSAATASAVVEAFYDLYEETLNSDTRYNWVQMSETIAHTNPSGIDARITMLDTPIIYGKNQPLKTITLDLDAYIVIGFTGVRGQTKKAVSSIQDIYNDHQTQNHIEALGNLTKDVISYVGKKNLLNIGLNMTKAHQHLSALGVSLPMIDDMVLLALSNGALGAKLTGGGLGGCVIALAQHQDDAKKISEAWKNMTEQKTWMIHI
ncbi:MAG: mevalonate kinase [Acholeplasmataceae bacterium]